MAPRYWRVLVLSGCLFKSEIGNRREGAEAQGGQASGYDVQPAQEAAEAESTRAGQVAYEQGASRARVLLDPQAKLTGPLEDD